MFAYQSVMKLLSDNDEVGNSKKNRCFLKVSNAYACTADAVLRLCFDVVDIDKNYTFFISVYMTIFVFKI